MLNLMKPVKRSKNSSQYRAVKLGAFYAEDELFES